MRISIKKIINSKLLFSSILSFLLLISSLTLPFQADSTNPQKEFLSNKSSTHTVLVEIASSQGCSACHDWNNEIIDEYENNSFNFEFVEMIVYDLNWDLLNLDAYIWQENHDISGYPTSLFDGGYKQHVGSNPTDLTSLLSSCEQRSVSDIQAQIEVFWLSSTQMNISIQIHNNETEFYNGSIRLPITEIISRYNTLAGEPFHHGFLDYAINKNITIAPGETYQESVVWDGKNHQDAQGTSFGDIRQNNIKLLLSVFDSKGFSDETVSWSIKEDINQSIFDRGFPIRHAVDGDWAGAQNISPIKDVLSGVDLYLRKFGTPEFNLTVQLRENNSEGSVIDEVTFIPSEVSNSWNWHHIDFNDIDLDLATDYFIAIPPAPNEVTSSFGYEWGYAFGNHYDDGSFWFTRDGGNLWRDLPTMYEFSFKTYGY